MQIQDVIIIGGGPAGLFASLNIKKDKKKLLLEKNDILGSKLLMSGSGQCNFTNNTKIKNFLFHYGNNGNFLKKAFKSFSNKDLINFFEKNNINTAIDKNNKVFPESLNSKDILNLLIKKAKKNQVDIKTNYKVLDIKKEKNLFFVKTNHNSYYSKNVIISTGGKSYPTTGSSGDGYDFAKKFNHNIISPRPALTSIKIINYKFKEKAGFSIKNANISLYRKTQKPLHKIKEFSGDILFTHEGLSGPGIINFSRYLKNKDLLKINFIKINRNKFREKFIKETQNNGRKKIKNYLGKLNISQNFIEYILKIIKIDPSKKMASITKEERNKIEKNLCEHEFKIKKLDDFNNAMVTAGGVSLKEISSKTMESKLIKGLYFIGEVLDIDGDTGGYNIQAAMSTAYICAKNIK
ncbi:MAG: NAD(P)/FAD-dependent oxidoreductase [Fusobacteriota bacterium]